MKCALVTQYGNPEQVVIFKQDHAKPSPKKSEMLVRVLACSLAASDRLMLSGSVKAIVKPRAFPYVPGCQICGVVESAPDGSPFKAGERIIASNDSILEGGMAEFCTVHPKRATPAPATVSPAQAAVLSESPVTAIEALRVAQLKLTDRVLIIGASGGVGSSLIQLVKNAGAAFIAATTSSPDFVRALGADRVIDYRSEKWAEISEFKSTPFDVVFDCFGDPSAWPAACSSGAVKSGGAGGRFVAVSFDSEPQANSVFQALKTMYPVMTRALFTTHIMRSRPKYLMVFSFMSPAKMAKVVELVDSKKLKPILEKSCPLPFTEDGVKKALSLIASGHAKGKVVVSME
jgi:NADPH:quinone reductase-like Zn-dependent oxidoreductase